MARTSRGTRCLLKPSSSSSSIVDKAVGFHRSRRAFSRDEEQDVVLGEMVLSVLRPKGQGFYSRFLLTETSVSRWRIAEGREGMAGKVWL
jgi:hypothetical protein